MILNKSQAEAVYSAMVALNNVSGTLECTLPLGGGTAYRVYEGLNGSVHVQSEAGRASWETVERHHNQAAFATAYGLQQG